MATSASASSGQTPPETINGNPARRSAPRHITIALAHAGETFGDVVVGAPLDGSEPGVLKSTTEVWESLANVQYEFVAENTGIVPDISVGLADFGFPSILLGTMNTVGTPRTSLCLARS